MVQTCPADVSVTVSHTCIITVEHSATTACHDGTEETEMTFLNVYHLSQLSLTQGLGLATSQQL